MAHILYALSGQGRGHTSRVMAMSDALRARGHRVLFCGGGTAYDVLSSRGEPIIRVPALRQVVVGNKLRVLRTVRANAKDVLRWSRIADRVADEMSAFGADVLITDFEAFSPIAARRLGVPVISFNHQEIVTRTRYDLPLRLRPHAALTGAAIRLIAPRRPDHAVLTSFFFPEIRDPARTTLVKPIVRAEVQALEPVDGEHVLVYFNQADGADFLLEALRSSPARFVAYNFQPCCDDPGRFPNVTFRPPDLKGFLDDLASCRGVICTAGFTLISEALYLGKSILVSPNMGLFEQTLNALYLERDGRGHAVIGRPITADDVRGFLQSAQPARPGDRMACGNEEAVQIIEQIMAERGVPTANPTPQSASKSRLSVAEVSL